MINTRDSLGSCEYIKQQIILRHAFWVPCKKQIGSVSNWSLWTDVKSHNWSHRKGYFMVSNVTTTVVKILRVSLSLMSATIALMPGQGYSTLVNTFHWNIKTDFNCCENRKIYIMVTFRLYMFGGSSLKCNDNIFSLYAYPNFLCNTFSTLCMSWHMR